MLARCRVHQPSPAALTPGLKHPIRFGITTRLVQDGSISGSAEMGDASFVFTAETGVSMLVDIMLSKASGENPGRAVGGPRVMGGSRINRLCRSSTERRRAITPGTVSVLPKRLARDPTSSIQRQSEGGIRHRQYEASIGVILQGVIDEIGNRRIQGLTRVWHRQFPNCRGRLNHSRHRVRSKHHPRVHYSLYDG